MHILMLGRGVTPIGPESGGAERACYQLARHLADEGDDVVLVADIDERLKGDLPARLTVTGTGRADPGRQLPGLRGFVRWIGRHLLGNVRTARRAWTVLGDGEFDVIHSHGALTTLLVAGRLRSKGTELPLLYTEHDSTPWSCRYRHRVERLLRRCIYREVNLRACRAASTVVTNFSALGDELAMRTRLAAARIETVPNGADTGPTGVHHEEYFLFVGSLIDRKAPDLLLRALVGTTGRCVFVGDGPLAPSLRALATTLGIDDRVTFVGAVHPSEVPSYYERATALVLPSLSEGVPLVALEALRAGVPVIATELDGIATVVRHEHNGLLVPPGDTVALAAAIRRLEVDAELLRRLGDAAAAGAHDLPDWHEVASRLRVVYARASTRCRTSPSPEDLRLEPVAWLPRTLGHPWQTVDAQQWLRAA